MNNIRRNAILTFIVYLLILLLDGGIRASMLINVLPENDRSIAAFVTMFSLLISTMFIALTIIITAVCTFLYLYIMENEFETNYLLQAWKDLLLIDIAFEVVKITLLWVLFKPELHNLNTNSDNLLRDLGTLPSFKIYSIIDMITIYVSIGIFTLTLYNYYKRKKVAVFSLGVFILLLNLSLYYKFI